MNFLHVCPLTDLSTSIFCIASGPYPSKYSLSNFFFWHFTIVLMLQKKTYLSYLVSNNMLFSLATYELSSSFWARHRNKRTLCRINFTLTPFWKGQSSKLTLEYRKGVTGIWHFILQAFKSAANMTSNTCNLQDSIKVTQECHLPCNAQQLTLLLCCSNTHHNTQLLFLFANSCPCR